MFFAAFVASSAGVLGGAGFTPAVTTAADPGDLIRGQSYSSVYYLGADGLRYVFPNEKTFFTWYDDFSDVVWISDEELGAIQIGGNVTYKPGVKLVKINTDPKTYAITEGGLLHWVETEELAAALYGDDWPSDVDDIPDAFFTNYHIGPSIRSIGDFIPEEAIAGTTDINDDKDLVSPAVITITGQGYSPIDVTITVGQSVRFVNGDTVQHTVTADDLLWGSGTLAPGAEFVHTFSSEGTFPFFDSYNSRHTGAVYVTAND
ncbi:cupredoxin domain-containing protein [Candidatus Uhrbacteria bacterium]|nr:cupredoxin domain-containing protein [Candidatus Uhrbacteria bacterium]